MIPAAGDCSDLWERQLKKNLFLIVNDIDSSPVDSNDDVVLRQARPRKLVCLVEPRKQQRPLVAGVVDDILLHLQRCNAIPYKIALWEGLLYPVGPVGHGLRRCKAIVWDVGGNQRLKPVVHHLRAKVDVVLLCGNHCQVVILQDTDLQHCTEQLHNRCVKSRLHWQICKQNIYKVPWSFKCKWIRGAGLATRSCFSRLKQTGFEMIDWVVVLHPTRHKIGHFGDIPQANLLAWYEKTKL